MHAAPRRAAKAFLLWAVTTVGLTPGVAGAGPAPVLPEALAKLEAAALAGSVDAQLELALAFDDGTAGKRDGAKAAHWYQRAADQNVGVAHLRLGMLREAGAGLTQSYAEARAHYERAVALGIAEANLRLGILYLEGWGTERSPTTAVALIQKAAEAGYRPAQCVLSDMYIGGVGVKRDPAKAVAWAERVAREKDPEGEVRLGALALGRQGLKQDVQLAREWFQLSAAQEYSSGMLAMAATFLRPNRTPADTALGVRWLELAVESGNSAAAFYLAAQLALTAAGTPAADTAARVRRLLEQAATAGESAADEVLEWANDGKTLPEAFRHVMTVSPEERYVERYGAKRRLPAEPKAVNRQPMIAKIVRPVFPRALRLTRTSGQVVVDFIVDTTGRVRNPVAVRSTHEAFSGHAVLAVRQWVFEPGLRNGQLVNTHMQVPVLFQFSEVEDAGPRKSSRVPAVGPTVAPNP
jgi:TonB family protein